jgi:hypothetical protein
MSASGVATAPPEAGSRAPGWMMYWTLGCREILLPSGSW